MPPPVAVSSSYSTSPPWCLPPLRRPADGFGGEAERVLELFRAENGDPSSPPAAAAAAFAALPFAPPLFICIGVGVVLRNEGLFLFSLRPSEGRGGGETTPKLRTSRGPLVESPPLLPIPSGRRVTVAPEAEGGARGTIGGPPSSEPTIVESSRPGPPLIPTPIPTPAALPLPMPMPSEGAV